VPFSPRIRDEKNSEPDLGSATLVAGRGFVVGHGAYSHDNKELGFPYNTLLILVPHKHKQQHNNCVPWKVAFGIIITIFVLNAQFYRKSS
jgi:hypothetical protein